LELKLRNSDATGDCVRQTSNVTMSPLNTVADPLMSVTDSISAGDRVAVAVCVAVEVGDGVDEAVAVDAWIVVVLDGLGVTVLVSVAVEVAVAVESIWSP
jgi:hypothetical protein